MMTCIRKFLVGAAVIAGALPVAAQVSTPESREAVLLRAERFEVVDLAEAEGRFDHVANPFYTTQPEAEESVSESAAPARVSDREVLEALVERINPSGVMSFGSQVHLLFGERRIKEGDFLSVKYQGETYNLQLMKVDTQEFVLRLNDEVVSKRIQ